MKKRLFALLTFCVVLDWYIKSNMVKNNRQASTTQQKMVAKK